MKNKISWKQGAAAIFAAVLCLTSNTAVFAGSVSGKAPVQAGTETEEESRTETEKETGKETKKGTKEGTGKEAKTKTKAETETKTKVETEAGDENKSVPADKQLLGKALKKGDCIGIAAPAGFIDGNDYNQALMFFEDMGYEVKLTKSCVSAEGLFAGSDKQRAEDINALFEDDSVDAIMCLRGGYGCARILEYLDYEMIAQHPKILIGYSDVTALHTALIQRCGLVTVHGPMISSLRTIYSDYVSYLFQKKVSADDIAGEYDLAESDLTDLDEDSFKGFYLEFTLAQLLKGLQSDEPIGEIELPEGEELETIVPGTAEGRIVGGNLTVLTSLIGTENELQGDGAILFLEEVREPAYRIDRMLQQLAQSGLFDRVSGIMFGDMSTNYDDENRTCQEVIEEYAKLAGKPCISNVPAGHSDNNMYLPLNAEARLAANDDGSASLVILDPAAESAGDSD